MKKMIPIEMKMKIKIAQSPQKSEKFEKIKNKPKVIVGLAADYGNLGDVAITHAQKKMLAELYPNHELVEVPISKTLIEIKALKNASTDQDIITTVGGGNMGDLYWDIELHRQLFFKIFKNNKIISFPQTIDFTDTPAGRKKLAKTQKVYNACRDLTLLAREEITFNKMKTLFPKAKVILTPDIVMTLDESRNKNRVGVTLCLREDKELNMSQQEKQTLINQINDNFEKVVTYDTHIGRDGLTLEERNFELDKIWNVFAESKVVVTDRLHGMIFCYITKTPCVALQNNNHKVKGCYEWIKNCGYIHLCETNETAKIMKAVDEMNNFSAKKEDLKLNEKFKSALQEQ